MFPRSRSGEVAKFVTYIFLDYLLNILVYGMFKYPLQMLRIGDFILSKYKRWAGFTELECREAEKPNKFPYPINVS